MDEFEKRINIEENNNIFTSILKLGITRNIIIYDNNAKKGEFTNKLIELMIEAQKKSIANYFKKYKGFTESGKITNIFIGSLTKTKHIKTNIKIQQMSSLNYDYNNPILSGCLLKTFYELGGSLASDDSELVIGLDMQQTTNIFNTKTVLLGSY